MSVVFDFNASNNDDAPLSPMLLSVVTKKKKRGKQILLGYTFDSLFASLRVRSSKVSVVFDFNASLNEIIPAPSTLSMVVIQML